MRSVLLIALALAGCWSSTGSVNYAKHNTFNSLPPGSYQEVGQIEETSWSNYGGFCNRAADHVLADALNEAHNMGGNALTDVKWIEEGEVYDRPHCESGFLFYWWGANATISARAVKIEEETLARLQQKQPLEVAKAPEIKEKSEWGGPKEPKEGDPWVRKPAAVTSPLLPAPKGSAAGQQAYAVVVGITRYQMDLPEASHAEDDARAFASYAEHTLGVPPAHIKLITGDRAGRAALNSMLEEWLPRNAREKGRVYFYFSGHGAPDPETGDAYLVPWDADPAFLKTRGLGLSYLYERLGALKDQEVFVFLDSCFSGAGQRSVLAKGTRPLVPVAVPQQAGRVVALTAAAARETTGAAHDAPHGLFTRHLLGGLRGEADENKDGQVTLLELSNHVTRRVTDEARLDNRDQTPGLMLPGDLQAGEINLVEGLR